MFNWKHPKIVQYDKIKANQSVALNAGIDAHRPRCYQCSDVMYDSGLDINQWLSWQWLENRPINFKCMDGLNLNHAHKVATCGWFKDEPMNLSVYKQTNDASGSNLNQWD